MNKSNLINQLIEAKTELERLISSLSKDNRDKNEGRICVKTISGKPYYVKYMDGKEEYIPKNDIETIKSLSQKLYNKKTISSADRDKQQIGKCIEILSNNAQESVLDSIPKALHPYINTGIDIDEEYAEKWASEKVTDTNPREADKEYETPSGIVVKSKSEWMIARILDDYHVSYYYEKPFDDYGPIHTGTPRYNLYPDFTCLNKRTGKTYYWEHLGKMDDMLYVAKNINRIMNYASYGIYPGNGLIVTYESNSIPFRYSYVSGLIEKFLI